MPKAYNFDDADQNGDEPLDEEGAGVEVSLDDANKDDSNYTGDASNPKDKKTGESAFDDLTPRGHQPRVKDKEDDEQDDLDEDQQGGNLDGADDQDEDEPAPRGGSSSWKKRLLRAERLIDETRAENQELVKRNRAIETRLESKEQETKKADAEKAVAGIKVKLKAAHEAGDTDAIVELQDQLADAKADIKVAETLIKNKKEADEEAAPVQRQPRLAQQWLRRHQRYHSDRAFQGFVKGIDQQVATEGFDPNSDEYWAEIDKRVKEKYPEEYKGKAGNRDLPNRRRHPASGSETRDNTTQRRQDPNQRFQRRGNKVLLSPSQLANMRRFGMDPDSAEDRKIYVRENVRSG